MKDIIENRCVKNHVYLGSYERLIFLDFAEAKF